ncbi:DUF3349 domain-containing protein [Microbacteriaceae bacterium VKM Ac-2854]|nr:DUF3349 domain-containing protein [Microbacteriaceae bacterium VKM Ac-2854]
MPSPDAPVDGVVARVVGWLRAGYPMGVPEQDYVPLLGILQRSLTTEELELVVDRLVEDAEQADAAGGELRHAQLRDRVEQLLLGPALPEDLLRVSVRLAGAGWPLGAPEGALEGALDGGWEGGPDGSLTVEPQRSGLVARVVSWLRAGYPAGLPERDFVPLVALLRRRLTDEEIVAVSSHLPAPASRVDVGAAIAQITSELPSEDDIERVRRYLAENGRPGDFPV